MYPWYKKNKSPFFSLECFQLLSATPSMYCSHVTPFVFAIRSDMTYRPVLWTGAPTLLYTTYNNCLMHAHCWKANSSVVKVSAYATDLQAQCYLKHNVLLLLNSNIGDILTSDNINDPNRTVALVNGCSPTWSANWSSQSHCGQDWITPRHTYLEFLRSSRQNEHKEFYFCKPCSNFTFLSVPTLHFL